MGVTLIASIILISLAIYKKQLRKCEPIEISNIDSSNITFDSGKLIFTTKNTAGVKTIQIINYCTGDVVNEIMVK
jgi:hypothetical protein